MPSPRVLRTVRENRQFELNAVARATGISASRLQEFELGKREPSFRQMESLASTYGLPSYLLGSDAIPNLPEAPTDFRRPNPGPGHLSPDGMRRIWSAAQAGQLTQQLLGATEAPLATWADTVPKGEPSSKLAEDLRAYFDEWFAKREKAFRFTGRAEQNFFSAFRLFLEAQGTTVRVNDAPAEDYLGFYLSDDEIAPTIFINRKTSAPKAQLFTLIHEFAHRAMGLTGVSDPFKLRNQTERRCNHFAAEFLAPASAFKAIVEQQPKPVRSDAFKLVDSVSRASLLSKHASAIRLLETEYIDQKQLNGWLKFRQQLTSRDLKDEESDITGDVFGVPHAKRVGELGYLPVYLAKRALDRKLMSSVDIVKSIALSQTLQDRAFSFAQRRMDVAVS